MEHIIEDNQTKALMECFGGECESNQTDADKEPQGDDGAAGSSDALIEYIAAHLSKLRSTNKEAVPNNEKLFGELERLLEERHKLFGGIVSTGSKESTVLLTNMRVQSEALVQRIEQLFKLEQQTSVEFSHQLRKLDSVTESKYAADAPDLDEFSDMPTQQLKILVEKTKAENALIDAEMSTYRAQLQIKIEKLELVRRNIELEREQMQKLKRIVGRFFAHSKEFIDEAGKDAQRVRMRKVSGRFKDQIN